ncbi:alpha/beta hydrolase [Actinoplanes sp. TBRC 11911]|uniref:alpha/beta hydrolase n=1 Tax=Actinoplanes sp. TBRC 11911 TaxID=2729386 RepID=UPI00145CB04A|nr:alpha/beta hydrolase [Actinoplanes sp. TBRC 11911]NMO52097.1 alpha/beta hydrolase [Actinoplanes sp. TBRC 11911]
MRPTFVLIPGAWHLPSSWDLLRGELDALGYASIAVKLATNGTDPRGGLQEDAAAIRATINKLSGPIVVVAHSYGGIPASEAVENVQHLVYLTAYVPDANESMVSLHGAPEPDSSEGLFHIPRDPREQLYHDLPEEMRERAVSLMVDQRLQPFVDRTTRAAWRTVPTSYIITDDDHSLPAEFQERMATRTGATYHLPTSHSPMLSSPTDLAVLLDKIASEN